MRESRSSDQYNPPSHPITQLDGTVDYQQFFDEPAGSSKLPLDPSALDQYDATLASLQAADPESYRMVLYSWA
ncbi:MAG: hypothetical protein GY703_07530 [Gammaproteobacteria bacterium]|nr:hypothetical protein [Gammaproteobacteria bacterium]